ncbi:hypothetical protein ACOSQ4_018224 [Xanthoceras sorbifolium]
MAAYTCSLGYLLAIASILVCSFSFSSASRGLIDLKKSSKTVESGSPENKQTEMPMSKTMIPTFPSFQEPTPLQQIAGNFTPMFPFPGFPPLPKFPPFPFIPTVPFAPGTFENPASTNSPNKP